MWHPVVMVVGVSHLENPRLAGLKLSVEGLRMNDELFERNLLILTCTITRNYTDGAWLLLGTDLIWESEKK